MSCSISNFDTPPEPPSSDVTDSNGVRRRVFEEISAGHVNNVTEVSSLCMACEKQGITRMLFTKIPHFKEVVLMAFSCEHCGHESTDVQYGGEIQQKGVRYTLKVTANTKDVSRQVVKSDHASILLPHIEFEIPSDTQKGSLNTIEGFLTTAAEGLKHHQPERRTSQPEVAAKLDTIICELDECAAGKKDFDFVLDDPAGNSFLENYLAPARDPKMTVEWYVRTKEQDHALCIYTAEETESVEDLVPTHKSVSSTTTGLEATPENVSKVTAPDEVAIIEQECPMCGAAGEFRTVLSKVPHFKEVSIMAYNCKSCGYRSNEVKASGNIAAKGKRIELRVIKPDDLNRSFLKSETAVLGLPECLVELTEGTLGSKFTTIEGMLSDIITSFRNLPFASGDSASASEKSRFREVIEQLEKLKAGGESFTVVVDDPLANSYIQNPFFPDPDPNMLEEEYERSWEQNEALGLNDMKTENYEEPADRKSVV